MGRSVCLILAIALGSSGTRAASPTPVIVELFTSEGCSDCPPADTLLENLIATQPITGALIIGLGQHVDYWDRLGWKDRFSSAALTSRQRQYQTRFGTESIYTPQMVVDGRAEFVGSDAGAARKAIEKTLTASHGEITIVTSTGVGAELAPPERADQGRPLRVDVLANSVAPISRGDRADIVLMIAESGLRTEVKRGENHGRTLSHAPVVRYMATVGQIGEGATTGAARADLALAPDWQRDHLTIVAFVQETRGRAILAAASAPLKKARP